MPSSSIYVIVFLSILNFTLASNHSKRQLGEQSPKSLANSTDFEDVEFSITSSTLNATTEMGKFNVSNALPRDPYEDENTTGGTRYAYRFYDFHGGIETTGLANALFWSQWTVQSKVSP